MSHGKMCDREKELEREVEELLRKASCTDKKEDKLYGKGKGSDDLPEELKFRESRLKKIKEAKEALEREAKEKAEAGKSDDDKPGTKKRGRKPKHPSGVPKPNARRNFTDPESRIMLDSATKGFVQGYNAQAAVDGKARVIVAADVTDEPNDKRQIEPMVGQLRDNLGTKPKELSADSGYYSETNVEILEAGFIRPLIPPDKKRHSSKDEPAPRGRIPTDLSAKDRMRRALKTKFGKERYKLRKETVEPVFGQIKQGRGFRSFLMRGLEKARGEWRLICATHNLLKLFRSGYAPSAG